MARSEFDLFSSITYPQRNKRRAPIMPETSHLACDAIGLPDPPADEPVTASTSVEQMGALNDDVMIDRAPDRPSVTIRVKWVSTERSTPLSADARWAD
jgi:hypothetical protein